jgi:outer membrane protein assembly factor BamB
MRMYDAVSGDLVWSFTTFGGSEYDASSNMGFSDGDIKEAAVYDNKRDWILFGSMDGFLYILERSTGHLVHHEKCQFAVWGTPLLYKNFVYYSSLDKQLRCLDLDTLSIVFSKNVDNTRIFASPTIINERLYIGTNAGRLHELDPNTGEELGYFQALERITNTPVYNPATQTYFLPTFANEIITLKRKTSKHDAQS